MTKMRRADKIAQIPLHPDAKKKITERAKWFTEVLTAQSKLNAALQSQNVVLEEHVKRAFTSFTTMRPVRRFSILDFIDTFGGILTGIGASSFLSEVQRADGIRAIWITGFTITLVLGIACIIIATVTKT